jgi:hypothetical protein
MNPFNCLEVIHDIWPYIDCPYHSPTLGTLICQVEVYLLLFGSNEPPHHRISLITAVYPALSGVNLY